MENMEKKTFVFLGSDEVRHEPPRHDPSQSRDGGSYVLTETRYYYACNGFCKVSIWDTSSSFPFDQVSGRYCRDNELSWITLAEDPSVGFMTRRTEPVSIEEIGVKIAPEDLPEEALIGQAVGWKFRPSLFSAFPVAPQPPTAFQQLVMRCERQARVRQLSERAYYGVLAILEVRLLQEQDSVNLESWVEDQLEGTGFVWVDLDDLPFPRDAFREGQYLLRLPGGNRLVLYLGKLQDCWVAVARVIVEAKKKLCYQYDFHPQVDRYRTAFVAGWWKDYLADEERLSLPLHQNHAVRLMFAMVERERYFRTHKMLCESERQSGRHHLQETRDIMDAISVLDKRISSLLTESSGRTQRRKGRKKPIELALADFAKGGWKFRPYKIPGPPTNGEEFVSSPFIPGEKFVGDDRFAEVDITDLPITPSAYREGQYLFRKREGGALFVYLRNEKGRWLAVKEEDETKRGSEWVFGPYRELFWTAFVAGWWKEFGRSKAKVEHLLKQKVVSTDHLEVADWWVSRC